MSFRYDGFTRIRAALELTDKRLLNLVDVNGDAARFPRGAKLRLEFGLFYNGELVDASQISAARLRIFDTSDPDSVLALDSNSATVRLNGGISLTQWQSDDPASAHIVVEFTSSQTAEGVFTTPPADGDVEHWFLVSSGSGADFIAAGTIKSFDGGYNPAGGTPPASGTSATLEAIDALINAKLAGVVRFVGNPPGSTIELPSPGNLFKIKLGCTDDGDINTPTQLT